MSQAVVPAPPKGLGLSVSVAVWHFLWASTPQHLGAEGPAPLRGYLSGLRARASTRLCILTRKIFENALDRSYWGITCGKARLSGCTALTVADAAWGQTEPGVLAWAAPPAPVTADLCFVPATLTCAVK